MKAMARLDFSPTRYQALDQVNRDNVRFHPGLNGPALGYAWAENAGGQMFDAMRHVLSELWAADLIDINEHHQFARPAHRVVITRDGREQLRQWRAGR